MCSILISTTLIVNTRISFPRSEFKSWRVIGKGVRCWVWFAPRWGVDLFLCFFKIILDSHASNWEVVPVQSEWRGQGIDLVPHSYLILNRKLCIEQYLNANGWVNRQVIFLCPAVLEMWQCCLCRSSGWKVQIDCDGILPTFSRSRKSEKVFKRNA